MGDGVRVPLSQFWYGETRIVLHITTFGGLRIEHDGRPLDLPPRTARHVLAYLILHHDRFLARDVLTGIFWPERSDARARRALSQALWQIRTALGPSAERVIAEPESVVFELRPGDRLDIADFEAGASSEVLEILARAAALYQGDFLAGCYDDWALLERERFREVYLGVLERLVILHKQRGAFEDALHVAHRLVASDPLRETAHYELMRLYFLLGRPRVALAQYETLCEILGAELGTGPLSQTAALAREIAAAVAGNTSPPRFPEPEAPVFERAGSVALVGRAEERAALLRYLEQTIDGKGTLVLVEGEAGVGKTRLLDALAEGAGWREVPVYRGRGRERSGSSPYGVLHEVLTQALTPLRVRQIVQLVEDTWLQEAGRVLPDLARQLPAALSKANLGPDQQRQRIVEGLCRLVLALGQIMPHVLILDDLQWADASTLAVLQTLVRRLPSSRVLVAGAYRGEEVRSRPGVWEALRALDRAGDHPRLLLPRLTPEETGELIRRGLGSVVQLTAFEHRLYQETDGNPLFVLETLRALHDEGRLYQNTSGDWIASWDSGAMPLPSGVQEVIEQRLARLSRDQRAVLEVASVLSDPIDFEVLAQTHAIPHSRLLDVAGSLVRRQLLVEEPDAYRFSHDKVQEVVYACIDPVHRRALHRRAGEALAARFPDRVEQLAFHFWQGEVWARALLANQQAGQRACAVYAGAAAFDYYSRAIAAWERLSNANAALGEALYEARGRLCQEIGRFAQAHADFKTALALAGEAGDEVAQARVFNAISHVYFQQGEYTLSTEMARQALALANAGEATAEIAQGFFNRANAIRNQGNYRDAIPLYERAIALFELLDDAIHRADALNRMGAALFHLARYAESHAAITRSLAARRRLDDRVGISYSLINLSLLEFHRGHFAASQAAAQEALVISRAIGNPYGEDAALCELGQALLEQGETAQGLALLETSLAIGEEIGDHSLVSTVLYEMGRAHHQLGDLVQAQALLTRALEVALEVDKADVPVACAWLARLLWETGKVDEALPHVYLGLEVAGEIDSRWSRGVLLCLLGQLAALQDVSAARVHFETSLRLLQDIGAEAELARSRVAYGFFCLQIGEARQGRALLEQARAAFVRLGMAWDLHRLEIEEDAWLLPGQARVRLASTTTPTGRPLEDNDYVTVTLTLSQDDDEIAGPQRFPAWRADVAIRRRRLLRLLAEAKAQGGAPTVHDLAGALDVSDRTIERDLAALRDAGCDVFTRGAHA